jgi:hypothetical protein
LKKRGGLSVILAFIVVLFVLSNIVLNIFIGLSEINTVGNLHSILRTEADTAANRKKVDGAIYEFFDRDVKGYLPVLKDYTTIYTVYEYKDGSITEVGKAYGSGSFNMELKTGQILKITIRQDAVSTLQKMNNLFTGEDLQGRIIVSEKRVVN